MALDEFQIIERYFSHAGAARDDVRVGVGDDAAILAGPPGSHLLTGACSLSGAGTAAEEARSLGHRALACALTRLAAQGAEPAYCTLALTLPEARVEWLASFAQGLTALAEGQGMALIGGDTTRGELSADVFAHGYAAPPEIVTGSGAAPGDLIYVTGTLGDGGLAILSRQGELKLPGPIRDRVCHRLDFPVPPVPEGLLLRGLASAAVPVVDGLGGDLSALLAACGLGATVQAEALPLSEDLRGQLQRAGGWPLPLHSPGDLALCFTVVPEHQPELEARFREASLALTWIGVTEAAPGLRVNDPDGPPPG